VNQRNYIILIVILIGISFAVLWAMIPREREVGGPIVFDRPKAEPSDLPKPWVIIPKPKPAHRIARKPRPIEYIDANGTRFYPMRNWPY
jgi:hypothetical protein